MVREFVTVEKTIVNFAVESANELKELKKYKIMVVTAIPKDKKIVVNIDKTKFIEIRVYNMAGFSKDLFYKFSRKIKQLV